MAEVVSSSRSLFRQPFHQFPLKSFETFSTRDKAKATGCVYVRSRGLCSSVRICLHSVRNDIQSLGSIARNVTALQQDKNASTSIDLEEVISQEQFQLIITDSQKRSEPVIVMWAASWCRKCIHLKPKLEKLAAEYYPSVRFYCVDVNNVPQALVNQAGVVKLPAIQLWKNGKKYDEVFGGHDKTWMALADIREMIEK
eukprot:TRINITY_DN22976_c0_g1_i1.p1 TRINITY_DN22976_c0_g1~~TRINITY_DN22976_c0_g1_i1.p1  ORF type:complete len:198 (+),score=15.28 TRINITY_DN22976_c0_g1_i1:108-701(+)